MAISKLELYEAFRTVAAEEYADVSELYNFKFSNHFESRMERLIRNEKSIIWHLVNTRKKRLVLLAAVLIMLIGTACTVPSIRGKIADFFLDLFGDHYEVIISGETTNTIEHEYTFSTLPDGFTEYFTKSDNLDVEKSYIDEQDRTWELSQSTTESLAFDIDSERGKVQKTTINGNTVYLYMSDTDSIAVWIDNGYLLTLHCNSNVDNNSMIEYVELIE